MKRKISKIFGVGLALVLVLSLSLVAAAPVAASPDVSDVRLELSNYLNGQASDYHIYFTPGVDLAEDVDTITILFPANTTGMENITDAADADLLVDEDGDAIWSARTATSATSEVAGYRVVVTTPVDIAAGTEARIDIIGKLTNPTTDDPYQVAVWTSQETTHVDSASYTIGATSVTATDFDPANEVNDVAAEAGTVGLTDSYLVMFDVSATGALALDWGTITVIFPPDTTVPSSISADSVYVNPDTGTGMLLDTHFTVCTEAPVVDGRKVIVKTAVAILDSALAAVYFTSDAGIGNPTCSTDGNTDGGAASDYVGKVYTSEDTGSQRVAFTEIINAASVSALMFDPDSAESVLVDKDFAEYATADDINIWSIDTYGNMADVPVDVVIDLASSSATGTFNDRSEATTDDPFDEEVVTIRQIDGDDWVGTFWYKDTSAGTATITASYGTWTPVTWDIEVTSETVVELWDGDTLVGEYTTIALAIADALEGNVIKAGPGTYTPASALTISQEGLTLESTDGAAVTIIDATDAGTIAITVTADDVTVDGFTIDNAVRGVQLQASCKDGTVKNCIFTDGSSIAVNLGSATTGTTVTDNIMDGCYCGVYFDSSDENTVSDNVITGSTGSTEGAISFFGLSDDNTITRNTITGNEGSGIFFFDSLVCDGNLISGNTISANEVHGIDIATTTAPTNLTIIGNDITDNLEDGILIASWGATNVIKFNTISGNADYGIETTETVDATHNYWGDDTGPSGVGTGMGDAISTGVGYEPWLVTTVSAGEWATGVPSLDARATVGVKVSGATGTTQKIGVARYTENPMATPEFTPLTDGFFDVYVEGTADATEIGIKFYADGMTAQSRAYVWDAFEEVWAECSDQSYNATYGYIWVKVRTTEATVPTVPLISELVGTPFAISTEEAPPVTLESIAATPASVSLDVDGTQQLTVTATYSDATTDDVTATASYVSSAPSVATVSTGGLITAVAEGSATVTVSYETETDTVSVTVSGVFDPMVYDEDEDGVMEINEVLNAISDYFAGDRTITQVLEVIALYF